jgi:outer membrane receptor for ferric coprogen and ferric-rhodotorulic acid
MKKALALISTLAPALAGTFCLATWQPALANDPSATLEEMIIIGIREDRKSRGATGLDLSIFETPQSLTILESDTIADFGLVDINSMLKMTTGVNVDSTETDRTYYNARGFDITSMNVDGVGVPFGNLIVGDLDTAIYEKVAVIRGSNGLITGLGNPSGTVNYVRKRPVNEFDASAQLTAGRWDNQRIVADINVPLTESGSWAARFVGVYQDKESWLDLNSNDRNVLYGIVDGQVSDDITLTFAYTRQDNNSDGVLWGAAPMIYTDGTEAEFDVSTTTSMEWTYWDTLTETAYAEMGLRISDNWQLTTSLTHTDYKESSELFYVYWLTGLDRETGLGMYSYPGKYDGEQETLVWDTTLQGSFNAWDQQHEFNLGLSVADADSEDLDSGALEGFVAMPSFPGWQGNEVPRPAWAAPYVAAEDNMNLNRLYGSMLLSITDDFKLILGMSFVDYDNEGVSWGLSTDSKEDGESPYIGFTWEVADDLNLYGSYSDIYQPQYYLDENLQPLGSAEGESYELGLKKQFNNNLLVTLALFRTEQENLQEFVEYGDGDDIDDTDFSDDFDFALYRGISVESEGVELEVAGYVTDTLKIQAGYTYLNMEDPNGEDARTFIPRKTFKLLAQWDPSWNEKLAMGLSARWQDEIHFDSAYGPISQDSYAVIGGYVSYELNDSISLTLNADNIADEEYLSSVKYEQSFFAAPRSYSVSIDWQL